MPMVARDGLHYGASIAMPRAGRYKLTYTIEPPTAAGRHSDPATGVDPWWKPFEVSFDWDYPGLPWPRGHPSGSAGPPTSRSAARTAAGARRAASASRAGSGNSPSGLELIASEIASWPRLTRISPNGTTRIRRSFDVEHLAEHGVVARRDRLGGEDHGGQAEDQPLPGREPAVGGHRQRVSSR